MSGTIEVGENFPKDILTVALSMFEAFRGFESKRALIKSSIQNPDLNEFWLDLAQNITPNLHVRDKTLIIASFIGIIVNDLKVDYPKLTDSEINKSIKQQSNLAKKLRNEINKMGYSPSLKVLLRPAMHIVNRDRINSLKVFSEGVSKISGLANFVDDDIQPNLVELLNGFIFIVDSLEVDSNYEEGSKEHDVSLHKASLNEQLIPFHVREKYDTNRSKAENTWVSKNHIYLENELFETCTYFFDKIPHYFKHLHKWILSERFQIEGRDFENAGRAFYKRRKGTVNS